LGFDLKTRIINCAVMTEKGLSEDFTSEVVKKYNRKVRGTEDEKGMNDGKSSFEIFTPSFKIIKATLDYILDENKVVDNVVSIDLDSRKVKGRGGTYKYEKLISTIHPRRCSLLSYYQGFLPLGDFRVSSENQWWSQSGIW